MHNPSYNFSNNSYNSYHTHNYPSYNYNHPSSRGQYNLNNIMSVDIDMGENKVSQVTSLTQDSWNRVIGQPRTSAEDFILTYQLRENSPEKAEKNVSKIFNKREEMKVYRRQPSVDRIEDDDSFIHFNHSNINSLKQNKRKSSRRSQKIRLQSLSKNTENYRNSDPYKQSFRYDQMRVILQPTKQLQPSFLENTCFTIKEFFSSVGPSYQDEQEKLMEYMQKERGLLKETRIRDESGWRC